jgi:hypothetical protein
VGRLAHHVLGEHLADWPQGLQVLQALTEHAVFDAQGASGSAFRRWQASLALAAGGADARPALSVSDRIAVTAQAATTLALHDVARSQQLLAEALEAVDGAALADTDPAVRALAVAGNNLAATLEERPTRSAAERALMVQAAQAGRQYWARAGTWLETERAEYRLARTWLAAGDAAQARQHAQACLAIVDAQPAPPPIERFFACEALALAERAAGNAGAEASAVAAMRVSFAELPPADQAWCQSSLAPWSA